MAEFTRKRKIEIIGVKQADANHQVVTVKSDRTSYRKTPCKECPWRLDSPIGAFPPEAYRISSKTAYDMAESTFSCHMAGKSNPMTCAGFLLKGSGHNLKVRLGLMSGSLDLQKIKDKGFPLFNSYREMAVANGVSPEDPCLKPCRD